MTPSIVSLRAVITSIGNAADRRRRGDARRGAPNPAHRRVQQRHRRRSPRSTSGSFSVVELKPSSFTLITCSHKSTGGLSIETLPAGSYAPKKKLCHDSSMLRTAAS